MTKPLPPISDERKRQIDEIRAVNDRLSNLADSFDHLRWMAEQPHTSDAFVQLALAGGRMAESQLDQLASLLEILYHAQNKSESSTHG